MEAMPIDQLSSLSRLPEELLLLIFQQLDSPPPSQVKNRQEPDLQLTTNIEIHHYKDISLVSRRWRRIVLPLLFSHSRLRLEAERQDEQSPHRMGSRLGTSNDKDRSGLDDASTSSQQQQQSSTTWPSRPFQNLQHYLGFIQRNNLAANVQSFVLLTKGLGLPDRLRMPREHAQGRDQGYSTAAGFWWQLYSVINPSRIVIVAPPVDMGCLAGCSIDTTGDWAFADMAFHILELGIDPPHTYFPLKHPPTEVVPPKYPGIAAASILKFMPWSQISLNEGSFLRAYGTYEYFERGPPSVIYSIKDSIVSNRKRLQGSSAVRRSSLRSFKYTAILPFASHVDFRGLLSDIEELDVKLAPDPGLLMDMERVGRAELEDCWQELFSAYRCIVEPFHTFNIRPDGTPKLKRFICRDTQIPALRSDLDDEFMALCLPVWAEREPGDFHRWQDLPPVYDDFVDYVED